MNVNRPRIVGDSNLATFATGERRRYDVGPLLSRGVFQRLREPGAFAAVVELRAVAKAEMARRTGLAYNTVKGYLRRIEAARNEGAAPVEPRLRQVLPYNPVPLLVASQYRSIDCRSPKPSVASNDLA